MKGGRERGREGRSRRREKGKREVEEGEREREGGERRKEEGERKLTPAIKVHGLCGSRGLMVAGKLPEGKKQFTVVFLRLDESITVFESCNKSLGERREEGEKRGKEGGEKERRGG